MKERVTYEEAKTLQKLGFHEAVDAFYLRYKPTEEPIPLLVTEEALERLKTNNLPTSFEMFSEVFNYSDAKYSAPTLDAVIDWAEKEYGIKPSIQWDEKNHAYEYAYKCYHPDGTYCSGWGNNIETREEAKRKIVRGILSTVEGILNHKKDKK